MMNDLLPLLQILGAMTLLVVPPILLARWLAGSGPADLTTLFRVSSDLPRAPGIQENDQPAFRFDALDRRACDDTAETARRQRRRIPAPAGRRTIVDART